MRHAGWVSICASLICWGCTGDGEKPLASSPAPSPAATASPAPAVLESEAFETIAAVLRHPRCLNCHPSGDRPRVGDVGELHPQNVLRGPHDVGSPGLHCSTCHVTENQDAAGVPGAPHWKLAPRSMGWEGLDDHDLAEALKDRSKNGDRSLEELLEHVSHDALVLWGWDPGAGREPVAVPHDEFVAAFRAWIEAGAASPAAKD